MLNLKSVANNLQETKKNEMETNKESWIPLGLSRKKKETIVYFKQTCIFEKKIPKQTEKYNTVQLARIII